MRWWREVILIAVFYGAYSAVRDIHGNKPVSVFRAATNAKRVISLEKLLGAFQEARVQGWFIGNRPFMKFWDAYYGTTHFAAVVAVLLLLFFRYPERYRLWRNTLAATTALALIGFEFFPLLPPRLLPASYHFVDTLKTIGGLWDFENGPVNAVSNQYAAMPSLHTAWSAWCAMAVIGLVRPWWGKLLLLLYPLGTIFGIVVTGNHYFADVAGGLLILGVGYGLAELFTPWMDRRRTAHRLART
ncbi:MAG: phosphatase PAP2 family protein [Acidimicrobiales bacterium]